MFPITGSGTGPGGKPFGRMNILRYQKTAKMKPPIKTVSIIILKSGTEVHCQIRTQQCKGMDASCSQEVRVRTVENKDNTLA